VPLLKSKQAAIALKYELARFGRGGWRKTLDLDLLNELPITSKINIIK